MSGSGGGAGAAAAAGARCPPLPRRCPSPERPWPRDDSGGAARGAPRRREVRPGGGGGRAGSGAGWPVTAGVSRRRMEQAGDALEEVLSKALSQRSLTLGVYEAAKLLNV